MHRIGILEYTNHIEYAAGRLQAADRLSEIRFWTAASNTGDGGPSLYIESFDRLFIPDDCMESIYHRKHIRIPFASQRY